MPSVKVTDFLKTVGVISDFSGSGRNTLISICLDHTLYKALRDPNPVFLFWGFSLEMQLLVMV